MSDPLAVAFREISGLSPWPELLVSGDGLVISANSSAAQAAGRRPASLRGKRLNQIFSDPADKLAECLRLWSTSRRPVAVELSWGGRGRSSQAMLLEGAKLHSPRNQPAVLLVRRSFKGGVPQTVAGRRSSSRKPIENRRAHEAMAFLARAGKILSRSLESSTVLDALTGLAVPEMANWCMVHLVSAAGKIEVVKARHDDQKHEAALRGIEEEWAARPGEDNPVAIALRTKQPQLLKKVSLRQLREFAASPEEFDYKKHLGLTSFVVVPILADQCILGTLTMAATVSGRHYDEQDLDWARNLGELAAFALVNARLFEQTTKAIRDRDRFLAILGHELRNPLGAISSSVNLLELREGRESRDQPHLANVRRQIRHLSRLVDDLLDVTRVSMQKISLHIQAVDLGSSARLCVDSAEDAIKRSDMHVSVRLAPHRVAVAADAARLEQVISNLLNNALKFTPAAGSIEIVVSQYENEGILSIRDDGPGLSPEALAHVFEPFWQADSSLERSRGGLGLGLTLARSLVEAMGGSIEVFSQGVGKGSEFVVRLPLAQSAVAEPSPPPPATMEAFRILIIEDNRDISEPLFEFLTQIGLQVSIAADGQSGLQRALDESPDVILIDIGLPGMSGYEVARRLRENQQGKPPRMVAMTGYSQPEDRARAVAAGFDAFFVKPLEMDVLLTTIRELAGNHASNLTPATAGQHP